MVILPMIIKGEGIANIPEETFAKLRHSGESRNPEGRCNGDAQTFRPDSQRSRGFPTNQIAAANSNDQHPHNHSTSFKSHKSHKSQFRQRRCEPPLIPPWTTRGRDGHSPHDHQGGGYCKHPGGERDGGGSFLNDVYLDRAGRFVECRVKRIADVFESVAVFDGVSVRVLPRS